MSAQCETPLSENGKDEDDYFFETPAAADRERDDASSNPSEAGKSDYFSPSLSPMSVHNTSPVINVPNTAEKKRRSSSGFYYHSANNEIPQDPKTDAKWMSMLNSWYFTVTFRNQALKRRLRRGIPSLLRPLAWYRLADISNTKKIFPNPHEIDISKLSKQVLDDIEKDIDRTYPEHDLFTDQGKGQEALRNILVWYAAVDPAVEYCQGMSFVAGHILTYFTAEEGFYCFYHCVSTMGLRSMYLPGLVDLQRRLYVLNQLMSTHMERLWRHLENSNVNPLMYATEWFMTLFCRGFDFSLSARVLEIFMFEGYKVIYRVALSILKSMETELLSADFEQILQLMRNCNKTIKPVEIMLDAYRWNFRTADLAYHEHAYDKQHKM